MSNAVRYVIRLMVVALFVLMMPFVVTLTWGLDKDTTYRADWREYWGHVIEILRGHP